MAINLNHIDNSVLIGTSEKVRIKSDGKVAIGGYGDPNSILDVRENKDGAETQIRLMNTDNGDTTTQTAAIYMTPDSRSACVTCLRAIKENADFSTNSGRDVALTFNTLQNNSQKERLRISSTGFVGIGSAIPEAKLDVRGNINFQNSMLVSNWDNNGASGSNIDHIWHSDASTYGTGGTWNFVSDTTAKATGNSAIQIGFLKSSGGGHLLGNVGIGVTTTTQKLHVDGNILLTGQLMQSMPADFWSSGNTFIELNGVGNLTHMGGYETTLTSNGYRDTNAQWKSYAANSTTGAAQIRLNPTGYIVFGTESNKSNGSTHTVTERVRIDASGHVDIGGANEVQLDATNEEILYLHGAVVGANVDFAYGMRIDLDDDDTGTTSADRERGCAMFQFTGNCTGGDTSNETRIWNIFSDVNCNEDYDNVYGLYSDCKTTHTVGTVSEMRGVYALVQNANSGNVTNMTGLYGLVQSTTGANSETVTDMVGVRGRVNMCAGSSTANATDIIGVWGNIDNDNDTAQPSGGKCALFYGSYDKTTGLSNPMGVHIATDVPNYFHGKVGIDQSSPTKKLHVVEGNPTSNDIIAKFKGGSGSDSKSRIAVIAGYSDTANDSEGHVFLGALRNGSGNQAHMVFETYNGTSVGERLRIESNGRIQIGHTSSKVGGRVELHNASAETWLTINESSDSGSGPALYINRTRGSNINNPSPVTDGNWLGNVWFGSYDTNSYEQGARIAAAADGQTWANGDCPARLMFYTTPDGSTTPAERIRITSDGQVGINNTNPLAGAKLDVRGVTFIADDIGDHQPSSWPNGTRQLIVYTSTDGQPIGNTACARVLIATDAKQTGAQGYHGSIDFGSSDCSAANQTNEYNWRTAAIMCRGDGDTSPSIADGDLQFWTKQASGGLTHRFDIAPDGSLTGTDTSIGTLSDQRLKTNIQDFTYDLNKFKQLKTRTFNWINPEFHQEGNIRGFIAQEIDTVDNYWNYQYEVAKESCEKDYDLLDDGGEDYTIREHRPARASKLNGKDTMYVSVIQQLMDKIETLEAKVAALEGS